MTGPLKHLNQSKGDSLMRFIPLFFLLTLSACITSSDPKLVGNEGQVYATGLVNQKVSGDGVNVTVWNIWNAKDGLPLAQQYCQQFGKNVSNQTRFQGITGYYTCEGLSKAKQSEIFNSANVKAAISNMGECIRKNVVFLDDLTSDAETIAKGVAQTCNQHWDKLAVAYISNLPNSQALSNEYKNSIMSAFNEGKVDKVLPYVLTWRGLVKKGWNSKQQPTQNEMPDTLFPKGI